MHRNLVNACVTGILKIFSEGEYSDSVIKNLLKSNPRWGSSDRRFIASTIYDTVRWWRKLWYIYGKEPAGQLTESDINGVLEIYFEEQNFAALPNRAIRESIPDWLDEWCAKELGEQWNVELHELNKQAAFVIRVNTLKTTRDELQKELKRENVETTPVDGHPDALIVEVRKNIFSTGSFKNGLFEVQDASSQEVAYVMGLSAGMRVIDACAGAGGKALHIAALMQNRGKVIALDVHEWKLKELQKRARRAGVTMIETRVIDSSKVIKRLENSADRVLIDAPCSGLGVMRRNPDIKWKLTAGSIERIREEQLKILTGYAGMTRVSGKLIYATCSILPCENEGIVLQFLKENKSFVLSEEKKILPSVSGFDGFYMACMKRQQ